MIFAYDSMRGYFRWTEANSTIIRFPRMIPMEYDEQEPLKKYKSPTSAHEIITQDMLCAPLNKENHIKKMHKLLELEELERSHLISRFLWKSNIIYRNCFISIDVNTIKYVESGIKFPITGIVVAAFCTQ